MIENRNYFASPPIAEKALLSAYPSAEKAGLYGIRIELEPLEFRESDWPTEPQPEIYLENLRLASGRPADLARTEFVPAEISAGKHLYEGSVYFCSEHHWVDARCLRFKDGSGDEVVCEFDLVIHLPTQPPSVMPLTLRVPVFAERAFTGSTAARIVDGIGEFVEGAKDVWKGQGTYSGHHVGVTILTGGLGFEELAAHARSVLLDGALTMDSIRADIEKGLVLLEWKFERFGVEGEFRPEDFAPRSFCFSGKRQGAPEVIVVLDYLRDVGHWSLTYSGPGQSGHLNWVPRRSDRD